MAQASADQQGEAVAKTKSAGLMRWAPLAALVAVAVAAFYQFGHYLSFEALSEHRDALLAWRDSNFFLAALSFVGVYAAVVALSIPGALWMTLAGGFLFGLWPGALMIIFAATLPLACLTWALSVIRSGNLRQRGPIARAWSQARIITPMIFSA